ncbi:DUF4912 domain-containing protein [Peribacillus saganii]|uniref:DUF4912 domain-containing protein n=1 Tax=Peribacillus saganii TaxID=2303992 RepID=A0A372LEE1_9BACI|nr:DUF4912 domain-containing protein [Peribacillus saganii]RFU64287.1 DUF4912 domain-containing protein [Peribacillus saganii]
MIDKIMDLRKEGLSFRKIAKRLDTTVGRVQYQWTKYSKEKESVQNNKRKSKPVTVMISSDSNSAASDLKREEPSHNGNMMAADSLLMDRLTLILMSSDRALASWYLTPATLRAAEIFWKGSGFYQLAIRMQDITGILYNGTNAVYSVDLIAPKRDTYMDISGLKPNRSYLAELGLLFENGTFVPLIKSYPLQMPRMDTSHCGYLAPDIERWKLGKDQMPNWIEHVSTYSYYEKDRK